MAIVLCLAAAVLFAGAHAARAQSSIGGTVKDTSGGVLPGVTVEVSSPALIEGTKTATTDGGGNYRVVDLRPGAYTVKFTLPGFQTVERSGFNLLSDFNARIDADMKVGAMEETVTVTGAAPIVDVQSAVKVSTLDREALDNIPTGKSIFGLGQLVLGVTLSAPDVGGSASAMSQYMSMRGGSVSSSNNTVMVDGMMINGLQSDGGVQTYINDADFQEMSYQTAGMGAERSSGGVSLNMVPKEGGNKISGDARAVWRPGATQGDNYTQRLKDWGLPLDKNGEPAINRIDHVTDIAGSGGGPIQKDKLWFFISGRAMSPVNTVPNTFLDDGSQGLDDNYIRQASVRLTYQQSPKNKFSAYYERVFKWRGHDMGAFQDPETTAIVWTSPNYSTMSAKYTGTISPKLLVEGGYSQNTEYYRNLLQPGVDKARGTAEWYSTASHSATGGGLGVAAAQSNKSFPVSQVFQGSISYVTGAHHAKLGASYKYGKYGHGGDANADLQQVYPAFARVEAENYNIYFPTSTLPDAKFNELFPTLNGIRPCSEAGSATGSRCSVTIRNTPRLSQESLNYDMGIYAQDSFTMKRLTINAGLRWEALKGQVDEQFIGAGRFVPERTAPELNNIPDWSDWAPRFQLVYDVFGNSRTAVKYSFNRYNEAATTGTTDDYNGIVAATSSRTWTDLNGDDIAQGQRTWNADGTYSDCTYLTAGCEINLSGTATQPALSPTFGLVADQDVYTGFPRRYRLEQGIEVQQAVLPRLSVNGTWYHGWNKNLTKTINTTITDDGTKGTQFKRYDLFNPLNGTPIVYYDRIVPAFPGAADVTYVEPLRRSEYDSYSAEMQTRPYAGAQISGGISIERTMSRDCETSYPGAIQNPNDLYNCDDWNQTLYVGGPKEGKPYLKNFKLSGAFPTVYGINLGVSYQNLSGGTITPTYRYGANFKYPNGSIVSNQNGMLGNSAALPACPTTYGCVPGAPNSATNLAAGAGGANIGGQFPSGYIQAERLVQLDIKASKNIRYKMFTLQPTIEFFNVNNIDEVRGRQSSEVGVTGGQYLQPNSMLQGRVIGFGINAKW
jgi:hypothetical protein